MIPAGFSGCAHVPADWKPHTWQGSPEKKGIERSQDKTVLRCDDPKFQRYECLTEEDLVDLALKCGK